MPTAYRKNKANTTWLRVKTILRGGKFIDTYGWTKDINKASTCVALLPPEIRNKVTPVEVIVSQRVVLK